MFRDVAELVKVTETTNNLDEIARTETTRQVFVSVRAVGQREVYEAAARGLKPSLTLILANRADYEDEQQARYDGKDYRIIRTYFTDKNERIELVCERMLNKGG